MVKKILGCNKRTKLIKIYKRQKNYGSTVSNIEAVRNSGMTSGFISPILFAFGSIIWSILICDRNHFIIFHLLKSIYFPLFLKHISNILNPFILQIFWYIPISYDNFRTGWRFPFVKCSIVKHTLHLDLFSSFKEHLMFTISIKKESWSRTKRILFIVFHTH